VDHFVTDHFVTTSAVAALGMPSASALAPPRAPASPGNVRAFCGYARARADRVVTLALARLLWVCSSPRGSCGYARTRADLGVRACPPPRRLPLGYPWLPRAPATTSWLPLATQGPGGHPWLPLATLGNPGPRRLPRARRLPLATLGYPWLPRAPAATLGYPWLPRAPAATLDRLD
jgi:hypothetical protein